jgi:hypothetical protein
MFLLLAKGYNPNEISTNGFQSPGDILRWNYLNNDSLDPSHYPSLISISKLSEGMCSHCNLMNDKNQSNLQINIESYSSIQDSVDSYFYNHLNRCQYCRKLVDFRVTSIISPKLLVINGSRVSLSEKKLDSEINIDNNTYHLYGIIYYGDKHYNCRFMRTDNGFPKCYEYDGLKSAQFIRRKMKPYFPSKIGTCHASYLFYVCAGDLWTTHINTDQKSFPSIIRSSLSSGRKLVSDFNVGSLMKDNSLCVSGFIWGNNSCAFDCVMTVLLHFYFQYGRQSESAKEYLTNLGCIGKHLQKIDISSESSFDPNTIKTVLYNELFSIGKFFINISYNL